MLAMSVTQYRLKLFVTLTLIGGALFSIGDWPDRASAAQSPTGVPAANDAAEFFEKRVRPVLMANCAKCHNPKAKMADLDLTTAEGFARGGESGPIINKSKPEESRLLKVIGFEDKLKMPPAGKLKAEEIAAIAEWVKMGAPWPNAKSETVAATDEAKWAKTTREFTEEELKFWAFQPMANPAAPKVKNSAWVKSPIDAFILAELEKKNLRPAPPADKLTLLRRATYDLTGLPPTETAIKDFIADTSPKAFEKVIERLLASTAYGEKWGRNWLDVARYADSTGNDEDHRYPHAWRYRDYVIESFNNDLPYDQFVREQIAGDLLPAPNGQEVNRRGIIATGFLSLGAKALAQQDKVRMLYDVYDEQVDVTSKAFLGLTMACARCHNHKFDPILTKDYYSMIGIFASTRSFKSPKEFVSVPLTKPLVPKAEYAVYEKTLKEHRASEKKLQLAQEEIVDRQKEARIEKLKPRLADYLMAARRVYQDSVKAEDVAKASNLDPTLLKKWADYLKPGAVPRQHLLEWHNAENPAATAQAYQQRFIARLEGWHAKVSDWRAKYQKALAENKSLPDKPTFAAGEDRFFQQIYLSGKGPFSVDEGDKTKFTAEEFAEIARLKKELEAMKKKTPAEPEMACAVEDGELVAQQVFVRGDHNNPTEDAPKATPAILAYHSKPQQFGTGSGRLEMAEWLTQPEHPLTARVMANRIWQWHFGEGLVRTPDNFGKMGERPTHPELLDWLSREFVRSGWSIKAMHRILMLSSAYQMSSELTPETSSADPENRLLSRFNRRRLMVEEMRDGLLAIDGSMDWMMGGTLQSGTGTDGENDGKRLSLNPEKLTRRSVYVPLRRANLPTLLNLFDFGDATAMSGKRQLTNVATQALFWMNSEFVTDRSHKFAEQLLKDKPLSDAERVKTAYLRILNRAATEDEIANALGYISGFKQKLTGDAAELKAWQSFCRVLMASNEFIYVD
ncbi:MAG: PSD1 and planctomycete cytochrome C domain-containing protein [Blastocatellia bacterium]